jgi:hypothetical protein
MRASRPVLTAACMAVCMAIVVASPVGALSKTPLGTNLVKNAGAQAGPGGNGYTLLTIPKLVESRTQQLHGGQLRQSRLPDCCGGEAIRWRNPVLLVRPR